MKIYVLFRVIYDSYDGTPEYHCRLFNSKEKAIKAVADEVADWYDDNDDKKKERARAKQLLKLYDAYECDDDIKFYIEEKEVE